MKRITIFLVALGALCLLAWLVWPQVTRLGGGVGSLRVDGGHAALGLGARPAGGDFRLQSVRGPVGLADLRGQVVLIYFGYTWCPDICPTNLAYIARALDELEPAERSRVQVLFISVDPGRDSPQRLAEYLAYFDSAMLGLTGSEAEVAAVARQYGAAFRRHEQLSSALGYTVDHTAMSYLVDPRGHLARTLAHATPAAEMAAAIRALLAIE